MCALYSYFDFVSVSIGSLEIKSVELLVCFIVVENRYTKISFAFVVFVVGRDVI